MSRVLDQPPPRRILFLDDSAERARTFLERHPGATWVTTVEECVARLAESWDAIYLDHDLSGEVFVDVSREDCGMAVVRWLCQRPRAHLMSARIVVHSQNARAAEVMVMNLSANGYRVEARPFRALMEEPSLSAPRAVGSRSGGGAGRTGRWPPPPRPAPDWRGPSIWQRLTAWITARRRS